MYDLQILFQHDLLIYIFQQIFRISCHSFIVVVAVLIMSEVNYWLFKQRCSYVCE